MKKVAFAEDVCQANLVNNQLRPNKITDTRLLWAMENTPRALFCPDENLSYIDAPVDLGGGRSLLSALTVAQVIQAATLTSTDRALVVGCHTGYTLAILSHMVAFVVGVECDQNLADKAADTLQQIGIVDTPIYCHNLECGAPNEGPYDFIFIEGAVSQVPEAIMAQLSDGGRLIALEKYSNLEGMLAQAILYTQKDGKRVMQNLFEVSASTLPLEDSASKVFKF